MSSKLNFPNEGSLRPVSKTLQEASTGLQEKSRTISDSEIPEVLGAALGGTAGSGIAFVSLFYGGISSFSAAGITSGLATAGGLVGGGMAAGTLVLSGPVAIGAVGGYAILSRRNKRKLKEKKNILLKEAQAKHDALIRELKKEAENDKERINYLESLLKTLESAINDLKEDLHNA